LLVERYEFHKILGSRGHEEEFFQMKNEKLATQCIKSGIVTNKWPSFLRMTLAKPNDELNSPNQQENMKT
jgi:hypothetical protein